MVTTQEQPHWLTAKAQLPPYPSSTVTNNRNGGKSVRKEPTWTYSTPGCSPASRGTQLQPTSWYPMSIRFLLTAAPLAQSKPVFQKGARTCI